MYVESFILTLEAPQVQGGSVRAGELTEGVFSIPDIPAEIEFGAVLQLAFDEDDAPGRYEVEILIEYARLPGAPQKALGQFHLDAVEPSDDWWGPRLSIHPFLFRLKFWDEFEGYLVVKVDGQEIGEKAIRVLHHGVPDGLPLED